MTTLPLGYATYQIAKLWAFWFQKFGEASKRMALCDEPSRYSTNTLRNQDT